MRSIVICEKPSQAANVRAAVGTRYGQVLAAQGHLLRLTLPEEENPDWKQWTATLLRPASGFYKLAPDTGSGKPDRFAAIERALAEADCVIIATDCDREGQAIGEHLVRYCRFKGEVLRAMFSAEDELTLQQAFAHAKPNSEFRHLYEAAQARQQADQIVNLSLTRTATVSLVPKGVKRVIGLGRVRTPTMALVVRRELELKTFVARSYFEIAADVESAAGRFRLFHKPDADNRIFDRTKADVIAATVAGWSGPIAVKKERKRQAPARPFDLPALQKKASTWGWSARKTLETAQALYETHKVTTYPRAATRYLPENLIAGAIAALDGLRRADHPAAMASLEWREPEIRRGKGGVFSDAGLAGESHHAIIPNPNVAGDYAARLAALTADERKLFDAIAAQLVITLGPDHVYDRTEIAIDATANGQPVRFNAIGRVTVDPGWMTVRQALAGEAGASEEEEEDPDGDAEQRLPAISDGDPVRIERAELLGKTTKAPPRYTEGALIDDMQNAWKFVDDPAEKARLKDARGIGTPATRDTIIEGLKRQELILSDRGRLKASDTALQLHAVLLEHCPAILDPAETARMEARLDAVVAGEASAIAVVDEICTAAAGMIASLSGSEGKLNIKRPPSEKMIDAARAKARRDGVRLPPEVFRDYDAARTFLGPLPERQDGTRPAPVDGRAAGGARLPSPAQIRLAERIAGRRGVTIPEDARKDAGALSQWIDANNLASEKQLQLIGKLIASQTIAPPPGYPDKVSASDASKAISEGMEKTKSPANPEVRKRLIKAGKPLFSGKR